jgi:hypothetical protein
MNRHLNRRITCMTEVSVRNCWVVKISNLAEVCRRSLYRVHRGLRVTLISLHPWRCLCVMGVLVASRGYTGMIPISTFGLLAIRSIGLWVDWRRLRNCGLEVGFVVVWDRNGWI